MPCSEPELVHHSVPEAILPSRTNQKDAARTGGHETRPTYLAHPVGRRSRQPVGVLLAARHFPGAAEIHLMAVTRSLHRRGVGRALVEALERDLIADGVGLLQVKTLGPSHPDPGYVKTRQFYEAMGFARLEENHDLWPANPCLIMIKILAAAT